jgi:hypothetical protein
MSTTRTIALVLGFASVLMHAQTPQTPPPVPPAAQAPTQPAPPRPAAAEARLPVRRVVLYKSGVGYFEHLGKVRGNQTVTIDFTSGQLDDVLKSLTTLDLDGGRVLGVSYNSEASLDRRLSALRLPVGQQTSRAAFLSALRGAKLEVRTSTRTIAGRLLSVERSERRVDNTLTTVDTLSLMTDAGELQTVALDPGVSVRIVEADLNQEVGRYLTLVASVRDQDLRRLTISTSGTGERDLFVSYISEVPVWKPTYRLVLPTTATPRKPLLQGWAIVDNTVGEDWDNVELSLVAGAPQSFVQSISRPYYVQRPVVPLPDRVQFSPQTHQSALGTAGTGAMAGTVTDSSNGAMPGATVRVTRGGTPVATATTDSSGRYRLTGLAPGVYEVSVSLSGFRTESQSGVDVSGGMETVLSTMLQIGAMGESVTVQQGQGAGFGGGGGGRGGAAAGRGGAVGGVAGGIPAPAAAFMPPPPPVDVFRAAQQSQADAGQLGDLFEYKLKEPVTIRKNQSALVPILSGEVEAEKVSLWNASSGLSRPLRAVWVTNATGLTLDGGSFSVTEGQAFAGEGIMDSFKPGEKRLLSYALDLGVQVDAKGENVPVKVTKVTVSRGLVIQTTEERQRRTYTARNEDTEPRVLVVEHPARAGWTVGGTITPAETTAAWHRFRVQVAPKTTATFTVDDMRPGQNQYSVSSITDDQIAVFVREQLINAATEAALRRIIAQKAEIARLDRELATRQTEIDSIARDQDRVRENMKSLKGSPEEKQLLQRYVKQLDDQENRLDVLRREVTTVNADRQKAQTELTRLIGELSGE